MASTSAASSSQQIPADFGSRFSAFMIDAGLLFAGQWIIVAVLSRTLQAMGMTTEQECSFDPTQLCEGPNTALVVLLALIVVALTLGYHALFEGLHGATPGKYWMGLRVEGTEGLVPVGPARAMARSLIRQAFWIVLFLSLSPSPLGLRSASIPAVLFVLLPIVALGAVASAAFTKDNRGAHDWVANTVVVRVAPLRVDDDTVPTRFEGPLWTDTDQPEDLPRHLQSEDADADAGQADESRESPGPDSYPDHDHDREPNDRDHDREPNDHDHDREPHDHDREPNDRDHDREPNDHDHDREPHDHDRDREESL